MGKKQDVSKIIGKLRILEVLSQMLGFFHLGYVGPEFTGKGPREGNWLYKGPLEPRTRNCPFLSSRSHMQCTKYISVNHSDHLLLSYNFIKLFLFCLVELTQLGSLSPIGPRMSIVFNSLKSSGRISILLQFCLIKLLIYNLDHLLDWNKK